LSHDAANAVTKPVKADTKTTTNRLPCRIKFLLALGEAVQGIYTTIAGFYLNTYFLETCCLSPAHVSLIQLIQGSFDAFNDPLIGYLSDRTRTRWGRRRPWLLFGGPFLAISFFGLWSMLPPETSTVARFTYYLMCYIGVSIGITSIQIQIASLTPELTDNYDERTIVSAIRLLAVIVAGLIAVMFHQFLVSSAERPSVGYQRSGLIFAVIILVFSWTVFHGIREKFTPEQETCQHLGIGEQVKSVFTNWAFWCVIAVYLCGPTAVFLVQTNLLMFCKYILGDADFITFLMLSVQSTALVAAPFWVFFGIRIGKREMYFIGGPVLSGAMASIYLAESRLFTMILSIVVGTCLPIAYLVPYSMLPDVIEDDELRTGKRREGIYAGFFTVSLKLSVTIAMTITNAVLQAAGYVSPESLCGAGGADAADDDGQSEAVLQVIKILLGPVPACLVALAMIFAWAFPITRKSHAAVLDVVAAQRLATLRANSGQREDLVDVLAANKLRVTGASSESGGGHADLRSCPDVSAGAPHGLSENSLTVATPTCARAQMCGRVLPMASRRTP